MSDIHQHYCRRCRAPWEHDGDDAATNPEIVAAHACPRCGFAGWVKFYGNETHDEMCEFETLLELSEDERTPEPLRSQAARDFAALARRLHRPGDPEPAGRHAAQTLEGILDMLADLVR